MNAWDETWELTEHGFLRIGDDEDYFGEMMSTPRARLAAAAPELYRALESFVQNGGFRGQGIVGGDMTLAAWAESHVTVDQWDAAMRALRKARGE